jgi:hypothetical protein
MPVFSFSFGCAAALQEATNKTGKAQEPANPELKENLKT